MSTPDEFEIVYKGELSSVKLERGDVLVFETPHSLNPQVTQRICASIAQRFPNTRALVLDGGLKLSAVLDPGEYAMLERALTKGETASH